MRLASQILSAFTCLCLAVGLVFAAPALAAETKQSARPDTPARITERNTPVAVELEGTDSLGARLSMRVKETLNSSNLFVLTEKDTPKVRILISTVPEFETRPGVGSAYSVVWLFRESDSMMGLYLNREVGVLTPEEIDDVAARIVERTDGIAVRYGYLFQ